MEETPSSLKRKPEVDPNVGFPVTRPQAVNPHLEEPEGQEVGDAEGKEEE